ncbi:MAG: hypothetical protein IT285_12475 [Bdellovibrionales bacterium]|nr:hypothetical protein [Bdellovibrionales bacterium]
MALTRNEDVGLELGVGLIVFGVGLMANGFRDTFRARKAQDTVRARAATAPQGSVEMEGYAWPAQGALLALCADGRRAVCRALELQRRISSGRGRRRWSTFHREVHAVPFLLVDESGAALVAPAPTDLGASLRARETPWKEASAEARERYFRAAGLQSTEPGLFGPTLRFVERRILAGAPVHAHGSFSTPQARLTARPAEGAEQFWSKVKLLMTSAAHRVGMLDRDRNGTVSEAEAEEVMSAGAVVWMRQAASGGGGRGGGGGARRTVPPAVSGPPAHPAVQALSGPPAVGLPQIHGVLVAAPGVPLVLSDCHEEHLIRRLRWGGLKVVAGAVMAAAGAALLANELGMA